MDHNGGLTTRHNMREPNSFYGNGRYGEKESFLLEVGTSFFFFQVFINSSGREQY